MNIAFIPVRGGSKSIPLKNIKVIAGHPLIYWTAKAASDCKYIDQVYVATDSVQIREAVEGFQLPKVMVVDRSAASATDTASTESAMLEFACAREFDNIVLIQATSPLLTAEDLNGGFELFQRPDTDSVLSVVRQKRFHWEADNEGLVHATNYDYKNRPRRQEFDGYLVENGAFYINKREALLRDENRLSGKIRAYEMDERSYFEIDEPSDWIIIEHLLEKKVQGSKVSGDAQTEDTCAGGCPAIKGIADQIKMVLTDSDGVLTDGGMYYSENGDELKKFNTLDGMGFKLLRERGIKCGIITGENCKLVERRAKKLKLDVCAMGVTDKSKQIREICTQFGITPAEILYIGDDINDLEVIRLVGYGCSVVNGRDLVKQAAKYVTKTPGGSGAVREIVDLILG